jgi:hypothetical protein
MIRTITSALAKVLIKVVSRDDTAGVIRIQLGVIQKIITIHIVPRCDERFEIGADHGFQADYQAGPYSPPCNPHHIPGDALHEFLMTFCSCYRIALRQGYKPREEWLVPRT